MIKHAFFINEAGWPRFIIEDKYWMLMDLQQIDIKKVKSIIYNLESVINGVLEKTDIQGYEITTVDCSKDGCVVDYTNDTTIGPLPVQWFLDLYKDWLEFLIAYEEHKKYDTNSTL